jgi:AcrR family transcriptional regulator
MTTPPPDAESARPARAPRTREVQPRTRRGRPPGGNSDDTRQTILDIAIRHFAERGYASTSLSAIAADAGLATSAMYHYYDSKEQLYEAVFYTVAPVVWQQMADSVRDADTMLAAIEALMRGRGGQRAPYVSSFLAGMPTVATLHPEFAHLLKARTKLQDQVFRALADLGLRNGELTGLTVDEATDVLRAFVMGWFFERHFAGAQRDATIDAVLTAFRLMATGAQHLGAQQSPAPRKKRPQ